MQPLLRVQPIPEDISVVGFDDIRYAEIEAPPVMTIAQPAEEI